MIGYGAVGTNIFEAALDFYDALFASAGVNRLWRQEHMAAWARTRAELAFRLATPFNALPASVGNGALIALKMIDRQAVDTLHARCLELGGLDGARPGLRGDHGFYGGYFRHLDGNKLNAYVPA